MGGFRRLPDRVLLHEVPEPAWLGRVPMPSAPLSGVSGAGGLGAPPAFHPSQSTPAVIRERMTTKLILESREMRVSVPLERPVKARATPGNTAPPQHASDHGPGVRPTTLVTAPAIPAGRAASKPGLEAAPWARR